MRTQNLIISSYFDAAFDRITNLEEVENYRRKLYSFKDYLGVTDGYKVRRLTPVECERLQGFPDNWTNIGEWIDSKGKKHKESDSPRYKALGNSIAIPFFFHPPR